MKDQVSELSDDNRETMMNTIMNSNMEDMQSRIGNLSLDNDSRIDISAFYNNIETASNGNVISEDAFNSIVKVDTYENYEHKTYDMCPISLVDFQVSDTIGVLPCNHYFIYTTLKQWLLNFKNTCPVCRAVVKEPEN